MSDGKLLRSERWAGRFSGYTDYLPDDDDHRLKEGVMGNA